MQISAPPLKPKPADAAWVCQDPDWSILLCRCGGLASASQTPDLKGQIQAQFEQMAHLTTAVRARVSLAQQLFHL